MEGFVGSVGTAHLRPSTSRAGTEHSGFLGSHSNFQAILSVRMYKCNSGLIETHDLRRPPGYARGGQFELYRTCNMSHS